MSSTLSQIGKYRIERELGRGAMGVVYKAFDPVVERSVAIKTIRLDVENAPDLVTRLRREAKSVGQLEHPNIVTLYDAGESSGLFYLAMQFIQGETLQDRMTRQGWFPLREVLEIFSQICAGLDYAHQHGVIHRDIKPANIMITHDGVVKLTDFGIAKIAGTGTTSTGLVVGTPSYMSPEQALGRPLDGRSDIFSLGSILYEMMTGEKAFAGQNVTTVMYKIVHEPPMPLAVLQPGLDPAVEAIVLRALAKNPEQRYQACRDLAAELELYITRAASAIPKTSVARVPAMPPSGISTGAAAVTAVSAAPTAPAVPAPATAAGPAATGSSLDEVPPAPVAPSTQFPPAVPPVTATQPVARQGVPVAWLGGGVLGTLLLVVVILLIVQMRQPSQAPTPAEQAPGESVQLTDQASSDVTQPPAETAQPAEQPASRESAPVQLRPRAESSALVRSSATQPPTTDRVASRLAAQPAEPAARQVTRQAGASGAASTASSPSAAPAMQPAPQSADSQPEPEASAPSTPQTYQSVMLEGDLAFQEGKYERARALYLKALRMNPRSRAARRKLVTVMTLLGKPEEALKYK